MEMLQNFKPGSTARLTSTSGGVSVTFTDPSDVGAPDVLISVEGTSPVYFAAGKGVAVAAIPTSTPARNGTPALPGAYIFNKGSGNDTIGLVSASSVIVDVTPGYGS